MTDNVFHKKTVIIAITGASGSILASKTIEALLSKNIPTAIVASNPSKIVWRQEMDESFGEAIERWSESLNFTNYSIGDIQASIASGTYPTMGMAIVPSSMATVSVAIPVQMVSLSQEASVSKQTLAQYTPLILPPIRKLALDDGRKHNFSVLCVKDLVQTGNICTPRFRIPLSLKLRNTI